MLTFESEVVAVGVFAQVARIAERFPGEHELIMRVGERQVVFGPRWGCDVSPACMAALGEFGTVTQK